MFLGLTLFAACHTLQPADDGYEGYNVDHEDPGHPAHTFPNHALCCIGDYVMLALEAAYAYADVVTSFFVTLPVLGY